MDLNRGEVLGRLLLAHCGGLLIMAVSGSVASGRIEDVLPVTFVGFFFSLVFLVPVMLVVATVPSLISRLLPAFCVVGPIAVVSVSTGVFGKDLLLEIALSAGFGSAIFYGLIRLLRREAARGWSEL